MNIRLTRADERIFRQVLTEVCRHSRMMQSVHYMQHGSTSVFRHSVAVAYVSLWLARYIRLRVRERTLIRGALLHDYFLYDWHEKDDSHKWHGFYHAGKALHNAQEDFDLNEIEQDMIRRHMFPLNLTPPRYRESWLLCIADKICSGGETAEGILERLWQEHPGEKRTGRG